MARPQTDIEAGREHLIDVETAMIEERGNTALTMTELAARARSELGATSLRLQTDATITDRAATAFAAAGWSRR